MLARTVFVKSGTKVAENETRTQNLCSRMVLEETVNVSGSIFRLRCEASLEESFQSGQIVITQQGWRGINI